MKNRIIKGTSFEYVEVMNERTVWFNNNPMPLKLARDYSETYPDRRVREFLKRKIVSLGFKDWIDHAANLLEINPSHG